MRYVMYGVDLGRRLNISRNSRETAARQTSGMSQVDQQSPTESPVPTR